MALTIRIRLTAWYTAMTALTGVAVLGVTALLVLPALPSSAVRAMPLGQAEQALRSGLLPVQGSPVIHIRTRVGDSVLAWGGLTLLVLALLSMCVGHLLAGRMLRPVRAVTSAARQVADRHLHERIGLAGPEDELKELADTFDTMVARLERSFTDQRRFIANASHELRTPLTTLRALVEVAVSSDHSSPDTRRLGAKLLTVITAQNHLLDGLLALAHSEFTIDGETEVDLADLAEQATTTHADAALAAGVELKTGLAPAPVPGDPALLATVVHNLVDNALRYNVAEQGWITVHSRTSEDGSAVLTVANSGPVINPDEVTTLFEPFRRLRYDRTQQPRGSGIGLAVVHAVVSAHHGTVRAQPHPDGGLTMTVTMPGALTPAEATTEPAADRCP
jgi:signal transduction histidine kinase